MTKTGKLKLNGKEYNVSVVDGAAFVEGIPASEFVDNLSRRGDDFDTLCDLAYIGAGMIDGTLPGNSPQMAANCLRAARTKSN
jgi:hypothetical protein